MTPPSASPTRARFAVVAVAAGLVLGVLGACGSNATTDAGAPASSTADSTVIAPETTVAPTTIATTTTTADPGTLPQTEEKPTPTGAQWDENVHGLWDAIVTDDPAQATPFFFPLTAYRQVKGISDPDHDYTTRLVAAYAEDIHALHKQLGTKAGTAQFVKVEVGAGVSWIKPGVEYNKGAYWRVMDNKIVYTVDGATKSFVLKSMISWRGQWYVVHLTAIR